MRIFIKARATIQTTIKYMVCVAAVSAFAVSAFAQDGNGPVPENAEAQNYGDGWNCSLGYRFNEGSCVLIALPENSYANGRSYGNGWACKRGYEEVRGIRCEVIPIPENAFLRPSGYGWECERGYRQLRDNCIPVIVPDNAYLSADTTGTGWTCERGFEPSDDKCLLIELPENAHLDRSGNSWRCDRSFQLLDGECVLGK
ncbi:hypothetical protein OE810_02330 [Rhodobacteraceae bacterium XHP0102]|nr:hypothetical protein [Rhodobacteraceae bacterium XHP0102]